MSARVINGDMLEVVPTLSNIDAVVTDAPYHLVSIVNRFSKTAHEDDTQTSDRTRRGADGYARLAKGFMGKQWDGGDIAFRPETWRLVFDAMKPGAYLVAFGGTRTYHRMACAIEDAGFEIRDTLCWLYGTGFPKSHDVSKGIDKATRRDFVAAAIDMGVELPGRSVDDWTKEDHAPSDKWWSAFKASLPQEMWVAIERRVTGQSKSGNSAWFTPGAGNITAPATPDAMRWQGWGTALKPAFEPIILARRPIIGTVVANVLAHGTGAINIDACRVPTSETITATRNIALGSSASGVYGAADVPGVYQQQLGGRWPANVLHSGDEEVEAAFAAFGEKTARDGADKGVKTQVNVFGGGWSDEPCASAGRRDSGTASRFFYSAKASKADRAGSRHPTVKPIALMRWLCRLVTPPGGTILDPFAGSGSTLQAAVEEGFNSVGIEREAEYYADICRRIGVLSDGVTPKPKAAPAFNATGQLDLEEWLAC